MSIKSVVVVPMCRCTAGVKISQAIIYPNSRGGGVVGCTAGRVCSRGVGVVQQGVCAAGGLGLCSRGVVVVQQGVCAAGGL